MGILMRNLILIIALFSLSYSDTYTFLVNKYDKEMELESKIIKKITNITVKQKVVLFIPKITKSEVKFYSKLFTLSNNCEEANFIFVKKNITKDSLCKNKSGKLYFTNNYKKLLNNKDYFGAFFWSKSRPNIVFIKKRLDKMLISLPNSYKQFVEDI